VVLVLLVVGVPVIATTTVNMIGFGALAVALLLYGGTQRLVFSGVGVAIVMLEIESAWNGDALALSIAAAAAGLALLAAFELRIWAEDLRRTASDQGAYRAHARQLAVGLGFIAAILGGLVLAARGYADGPTLGIVAGLAAFAVGGGVLWLAARVR
jgi:hypothetical protein